MKIDRLSQEMLETMSGLYDIGLVSKKTMRATFADYLDDVELAKLFNERVEKEYNKAVDVNIDDLTNESLI